MKQCAIALFQDLLSFASHCIVQHSGLRSSGADQPQHFASSFHSNYRILFISDMKQHGIAQMLAQMPSGVGVVADECDPVRTQMGSRDRKDTIADLRRSPCIEAVRDDVVEFSEIRADF